MRYPTAKTIEARLSWLAHIGDPTDLARQVRRIIDGTDPAPQPPRIYHPADSVQCKLHALNLLLDTFGVEYLTDKRDTYTRSFGVEYLNTGDTYTPTVCYDHSSGTWRISSWGGIVENNERRFGA